MSSFIYLPFPFCSFSFFFTFPLCFFMRFLSPIFHQKYLFYFPPWFPLTRTIKDIHIFILFRIISLISSFLHSLRFLSLTQSLYFICISGAPRVCRLRNTSIPNPNLPTTNLSICLSSPIHYSTLALTRDLIAPAILLPFASFLRQSSSSVLDSSKTHPKYLNYDTGSNLIPST